MQHAGSDSAGDAPVVVVGLMGSGKSTLAAALAHLLHRPLHDSDGDIGRDAGASTAEIAAEPGGLDRLHELEAEHVLRSLDDRGSVVAAAASVIERPVVRRRLLSAFVIWLDAEPVVLAQRLTRTRGGDRPHLGDPLVVLSAQDQLRRPLFAEVADVVIDARLEPEQVLDKARDALSRRALGG